MGTRPGTSVRALRRRNDALLTIWLAFLDELDNPVRPRAAEFPQGQENGLAENRSTRTGRFFCRLFYPGQQRCHLGMETPTLLGEDYGAWVAIE